MNIGETEVKTVARKHQADVFVAQTSSVVADVAPGDLHYVPPKRRKLNRVGARSKLVLS